MQMIQLPDEIAALGSNGLFVYWDGQLLLDSVFFGIPLSADYDISGAKLNLNRKAKVGTILQLVCSELNARWIYQHNAKNGWALIGKFPY